MYYNEIFPILDTIENLAHYKPWRRILGDANYSDKHQERAAMTFVISINRYGHHRQHSLHSKRCDKCLDEEKCFQTKRSRCCGYVDVFKITERLGSQNDHYDEINEYLNTIGLSLQVLDRESRLQPIYSGIKSNPENKTIHLDLFQNHFNFIRSLTGYYNRRFFCHICRTAHDSISHQCEGSCYCCGAPGGKCIETERVSCDACSRTYLSRLCYEYHLDKGSNRYCKLMSTCEKCGNTFHYTLKDKHKCFEYECLRCRTIYTATPHICQIKPGNKDKWIKEDEQNKIIVCFDIESALVQVEDDENERQHRPNLLITEIVCDVCYDHVQKKKVNNGQCGQPDCESCERREPDVCKVCYKGHYSFEGYDCVTEFCDLLYKDIAKRAEENKCRVMVYAHNFKGYDGHFIFTDLFSRHFKNQPEPTMQGTKILRININNISFVDTLCLFLMPLASLPKTFGFKNDVKGFFPHLFNQPDNWNYSGPLPAIEYFDCDNMRKKTAEECEKWHETWPADKVWNFREEIIKYCENDVRILTKSIMEFRNQFIKITGLDPITRRFTIAGVAREHYLADFLTENTMYETPASGYISHRNQSVPSNIWLDFQESKVFKVKIHREQRLGQYFVDGFIPEMKTVFEFLGCIWHGCEQCYPTGRDVQQFYGRSLNQKSYELFLRREWFKRYGYKVVEIWGHDFNKELETNQELQAFRLNKLYYYNGIKEVDHLNIRDAFFGGRVEPFELQCDFDENGTEYGKYFDVTSLYPYVMSKKEYGIGLPHVITEFNGTEIKDYFGFIKCQVLAPDNLLIPVLPVKYGKKLYFPLCIKCIELMNDKEQRPADKVCPHDDRERAFVGTWFSEELKLAVKKGYKINRIYQVVHYDQKSKDLFKGYINSWVSEKVKASDNNLPDDESKVKFCEEYRRREGIDITPEELIPNPGKRAIAKLMANSLWGKFAQRPNQPQTVICKTNEHFRSVFNDAKHKIKGIELIDEDTILVNYKYVDDSYDKSGQRNIGVAAMVTGYARMTLYEYMDGLEKDKQMRVMYCDTDSVIFKHDDTKGWDQPELGYYLGEMTDELTEYGEGAKIVSFSSGGPKNYGYQVKDSKGMYHQQIKIKGISFNRAVVNELQYQHLKRHAVQYLMNTYMGNTNPVRVQQVPQLQFQADAQHRVTSRQFLKKYKVVYSKRIPLIGQDFRTIPYGFKFTPK